VNPVDLAWAAGFLDGEGHFGLAKPSGSGVRPGTRSPIIYAVQTKRLPLELLEKILGGKIGAQSQQTAKGSPLYQWRMCTAREIATAIESLLPYLVVKQVEARIVLSYTGLMGYRGRVMTEDIVAQRCALVEELEAVRR
jgi:hypothetical protein